MNTAPSPLPTDESRRLARLKALMVLDTEPEPIFDALARAASSVCGTPIGLLTLIEQDRQWFKARVGVDVAEVPRNISFCAHTVLGDDLIEVPDATDDARFAANPLVTDAPGFRFYAGTPLVMSSGERVGTLCVLDTTPHHLTDTQRSVLKELATSAVQALEMRERAREVAIVGSDPKFQALSDACPFGIFHTDLEGRCTYTNPRWQELYGLSYEDSLGHGWADALHPDDRAEVFARWQQSAASGEEFDMEFRIRQQSGEVLYVRAKARSHTDFSGKKSGYVGAVYDVTQRREAEDRLRASNSFLDRAERIAGVGGWELDLEARTLHWTDQTCRIYDLPAGHQPTVDEHLQYFDAEACATIERTARESAQSGKPWDLELPMVTAAGRRIWVRSVGHVIKTVGGAPVRLVGALQDVTTKRALEDELRRSNDLLAAMLESLPCAVSVFDAKLELVAHNRNFQTMLGFPRELFASPRAAFERFIRFNAEQGEYGDGDLDAKVRDIVARASEPSVHRFERTRPNGLTLEIQGAPMPGGGFVTTYTDISERKRSEQALRTSEERLTRALDATGLALWDFDVERGQVYLSEAWSTLLGGPPQATVTTFAGLAAQVPEQDQAALLASLTSVLKGNAADYSVEHRVRRHDGQLIWVHSDGRVTQRNSQGRAMRLVGTNREITRQKEYERSLQAAKDAAEQAMQAKSSFLAAMSHEIRTPMNGVIGMTTLLMDTPLNERQREFVEVIRQSGEGLLVVINDILDYSKIESGHMELEQLPFDLQDTVESSVELLALKAQEKNLDVLCEVAADIPPWIEGDYARLRQVLVNLISNAVKFTDRGTVQVSVRQVPADTAGQCPPLQLEFCVRDTGIGIPADKLPRLFQAFSQADSSTSRKYGGTGLGLVISQRLVEAMKGSMWVESEEGQGTRFYFTLPTAPAMAMNAPPPLALNQLAKKRVMVVDDNPACLQWLCQLARRWDMAIIAVGSGAEALAQLTSGTPCDLLVTDLTMPGMDGLALARAVRAMPPGKTSGEAPGAAGARLPMLLLSGAGMPASEDAGLFDAVVIKPARVSVLAQGFIEALAERGTAAAAPVLKGRQFDATLAQRYPQRILLAEDNEINRKVAIQMLKGFGYRADVAANGLEAVDAVRRQPYDLVLMDIQMPELDGMEATRILVKNRPFGGIPRIVGMSAHAIREDIDAALEAGMDDYIVKPVTAEALREKLVYFGQRIAGTAGRAAAAPLDEPTPEPSAPAAAPTGGHDLLDLKQVHSLISLDPSGKLMAQLIGSFGPKTSKLLDELRAAAQVQDADAAGRLAHQLKGTAGTLGMRSLARHAAEMEVSLAAGLWAQLGDQLASADDRCTSSLTALTLEMAAAQPALAAVAADGVSE
ncbi:PAS domain-containing protein [Polaromonas sp. YR568]|uniref:PAS domain-containing protein n=1 Tax=Polaromonas sp. YR568 TaxID=1855301 RepID=UPI003137D8BF